MADRKQFINVAPANQQLLQVLERTRNIEVSEEQLREQRVSFAFGNGMGSDSITKESVRFTSQHLGPKNEE